MKTFIQNRKGEKVCVRIEKTSKQKALAFVMHGCGGNKDESHIRTYIQAFLDNGIDVVSFDTTNTFGESDGKFENSTISNYLEDLEDVIKWSETQDFYQEPFFLMSHSCSGLCTGTYVGKNKHKIKGFAPTATVVSGKLSWEQKKDSLKKWKQDGFIMLKNSMSPTGFRKLKWQNMEDRLQYDLLEIAPTLDMPVLMMVGDKDTSTPLEHQQLLFEKIPAGNKQLEIFNGPHYDFNDEQLSKIYKIVDNWIKKVNQK